MLTGTCNRISVKLGLILFLTLLASSAAFGQSMITPSTPPVVNQGTTFKFTANVPVTWSMAPGSKGSIDADGTYHAPAIVTAQQSIGGCQLLPNDHIINTRIDSLPVNSNSAAWISSANYGHLQYSSPTPVNYADASTPTQNMVFQYTPAYNGPFTFPIYPYGEIEAGWYSDMFAYDHHEYTVNPTTCEINEINSFYPVGSNSGAPLSNSVAGIKYNSYDYALPGMGTGAGTDAAGMTMLPMMIHLQEWKNAVATGGTINHAIRITFRGGGIKNLVNLWPATQPDYTGFGLVPFGARVRLKSSFNLSGFSPYAQVLLKQLQQYGAILDDTGSDWNVELDATKYPYEYQQAIYPEIFNANIAPSNFEFVDESSLMVSASSGITTACECVVATNATGTSTQRIVLTGLTLGLPHDQLYIQAGTGPQQFTAFINGTSNTGITWTMSPSVGTLTSAGLYTPPATAASSVGTLVTATSQANTNIVATMPVIIFPTGTIRILMSGPCQGGITPSILLTSNGPCTTTPFTDSHGNSWQGTAGADVASVDNCGGNTIPPWPNLPDIALYEIPSSTGGAADMRFDITVSNGVYSITGKFAVGPCPYNNSAGQQIFHVEAQGQRYFSNVDIAAAVGAYNPFDLTLQNVQVTKGQLSFVLRFKNGGVGTVISALEIDPVSSVVNKPDTPTGLSIIQIK